MSRRAVLLLAVLAVSLLLVLVSGLGRPKPVDGPTRDGSISRGALKMMPENDIYPPLLHSEGWLQPTPLPYPVNSAGGEDSAFILPEGNVLYFWFTPNVSIPAEKQLLDGVTGIYVSKWKNGTWGPAERVVLQDPGKLALDGAEFVQGNVMWFASAREGYVGVNLFTAEFKDGKWQNWQYVGDRFKELGVGEMHISADGSEMYFHSTRVGGKGKEDIWVMRRVQGLWQEPENVEAVNSEETEGWPFLTEGGDELWFTRTYLGSPAIYRSRRVGGVWSTPELILSQFAGEPSLDREGNIYFTHHFFKEGRMVEADIYMARVNRRS